MEWFRTNNKIPCDSSYVEEIFTPKTRKDLEAEEEQGSLTVDVFSKPYLGLLAQYLAVGLLFGVLPSTVYPFIQVYLNASGAQVVTAATLITLPYSLKVFFGALSDCFPILGYRRRSYMLIDWTICVVMLFTMAFMEIGEPYFLNPADRLISPEDYTPEIEARLNRDAPLKAGRYVFLMMFTACGNVLANVCADGLVVGLAQQEPLETRGRAQSVMFVAQLITKTLAQALTGFAFNGAEYGGTFEFSLTFSQLMLMIAIGVAPIIPVTWFCVEESPTPAVSFSKYVDQFWQAMKTRAVYQFVFYSFFSGISAHFSFTAMTPVQLYMVGVTAVNNALSDIIGSMLCIAAFIIIGKYGLGWNWRVITVSIGVLVLVLDSVFAFITIWGVFRSQWFWLGLPIVIIVPFYIHHLICSFVAVELIDEGREGAMFGLLISVNTIAMPFATTLTRIVDSYWDFSNERIQIDDYSVRLDITQAILLMYGMTIVSWLFLFLLPRQKTEVQELKRSGGSSSLCGALTVAYLSFALVWSVACNVLAIIPSTSCLVIAGGKGC